MTDKTEEQKQFDALSGEQVASTDMSQVYEWLRNGVSPKSIAAKLRISPAQLDLKLHLYPDFKADWDEAVADYEIYHVDKAKAAAEHDEAPLALKVKYHMEQLKKLNHHATATAPVVFKDGGQASDLEEPAHEEMSPEQLAAIREETEARGK
jgi:hypothetical protein